MAARGTRETKVKVRDLEAQIKKHGCEVVRSKGSHVIFKTPKGATFPLPMDGKGRHVSENVFASIRKVLLPEGLDLKEVLS